MRVTVSQGIVILDSDADTYLPELLKACRAAFGQEMPLFCTMVPGPLQILVLASESVWICVDFLHSELFFTADTKEKARFMNDRAYTISERIKFAASKTPR